jgi:hypothetical protein
MKTTTLSRRASFASKRFLLLEEILPTFNGISVIIRILRRHKSSGNKVDKITIIALNIYLNTVKSSVYRNYLQKKLTCIY